MAHGRAADRAIALAAMLEDGDDAARAVAALEQLDDLDNDELTARLTLALTSNFCASPDQRLEYLHTSTIARSTLSRS